jgi:hypothetical protein
VKGVPVSYVVVPRMQYVILRVMGEHPNKRELVRAVREGRVSGGRVRSSSEMQWSKAVVRREVVRA